jgi:hypothetical protein
MKIGPKENGKHERNAPGTPLKDPDTHLPITMTESCGLKVYDANDRYLGILLSYAGNKIQIYNPTLGGTFWMPLEKESQSYIKAVISDVTRTPSRGPLEQEGGEFQGPLEQEDLGFFRGICVALPISLAMWALIIALASMVF